MSKQKSINENNEPLVDSFELDTEGLGVSSKNSISSKNDKSKENDEDDDDDKEKNNEKINNDNLDELEDSDEISFTPFVESLVENEILTTIEDFEKYEDSEEGFQQLIEDEVKGRFDMMIENLPEEVQELIEIGLKGGDIKELVQAKAELIDFDNVDVSDEETQRNLVYDYYSGQGISEKRIKALIEKAEEDGELEDEAKLAIKNLKRIQEEKIAEIEAEQQMRLEELENERIQAYNQSLNSLKETLNDIEEIDGVELSKKDKQKLFEYMTRPVKTVSGTNITQTRFELDVASMESKVRIAYHLLNGFTSSQEEVVRKVKNDLNTKLFSELSKRAGVRTATSKVEVRKTTSKKGVDALDNAIETLNN